MKLKFTALAIMFALSAFGQANVAVKPEAGAPKGATAKAPHIDTGKLWRLLAQAQQLRQQVQATPQWKAAEKADEVVAAEQQRLSLICGPDHVLGYDQDVKSERYQDLICVVKPPAEAPAPAKKATEEPKGK